VADDEPDTIDYFSAVLEDNGAQVVQARDGDEALALIRQEKPDLVVLDLDMPGKDGGEVFEAIRKDPELSETKVCIITGKPELRRLIYERPVPPPENYLAKPVSDKDLVLNVRKVLDLAQQKNRRVARGAA
jgi:CheY-like chemotaxis protein